MKAAAIYARVSSDQQKEDKTIASQSAALVAFAQSEGYSVPAEWIFLDEGYSGAPGAASCIVPGKAKPACWVVHRMVTVTYARPTSGRGTTR